MSTQVRPLDGLKVLDFTRQMSGPYATLMLADYGADVIKVESLPLGDGSRNTGTDFIEGESAIFLMWNRGKRSIALDLQSAEGKRLVAQLARDCDVVVENYRPGVAEKVGIGYEQLAKDNPRLIHCSISAFGSSGPLAEHPGTDPVIQAMSGVMSVTGEPGGQAVLTGVPIADFTAALLGVQAILLALSARERTGRGQKADVSMLSGLLLSLTTRLATHWATGEDPRAFGSSHSIVTPYQAFATKDGQVVAGVWGNEGWPRFCKAIQRPDLAADPRFTENVDRMKLRDELEPILNEVFLTKTTVEWEKSFREEQALFGPVYKFSEILNHPHIQQAGLLQSVDHPKLGPLKQLGPVIEFSETPGRISGPPPLHGEHTVDVLSSELGLTETQIQSLVESGVIKDGRLHAEPRPE